MFIITFTEAVKLKSYVWEHFKVNLHIHDTCGGGLYFTTEKAEEEVLAFLVEYFKARGMSVEISKDRTAIFLNESAPTIPAKVEIRYEKEAQRAAAYDQGKCIGECTYLVEAGKWIINHTEVKEAYRDQMIARKLVDCVVEEARKAKVILVATCSYAQKILAE